MADVYYLTYRPQKIDQLDLTEIREQLVAILAAKNIPHALLFSGPKGLGKTSAARIVAKSLNCTAKQKGSVEPCNKCLNCIGITRGTALDLIEIDAASNRGIDDIRELKEKIKLSPTQTKKKVYVIDEAHMLTSEAFNALLKTLEEPPEHAFFILCTTEPNKLPSTIISRCQQFAFSQASVEEIVRSLTRIVKGEKLHLKKEVLELIAKKADGSFRDASKILQQLSFSGKTISFKQAETLLEKELITSQEILHSLAKNNQTQALRVLDQAVALGLDLKVLTMEILEELRQLLLAKYGLGKKPNCDLGLSVDQLKTLVGIFDLASRQLKDAVISQLPLELAIMEAVNLKANPAPIKIEQFQTITTDQETEKWPQVLRKIKADNHSLEALLKSTQVKAVSSSEMVIEVFYEFHKKKLEAGRSLELVSQRVREVYGLPLKIKYVLRTKEGR